MIEQSENLCNTCSNAPECFLEGIIERHVCDKYDPLSLDELLARDEFLGTIMVGDCPKCGGQRTCDCETNPLAPVLDNTIGSCLDCGTYWCLECGYIFRRVEKGMQCPHWKICAECSDENDYLTDDEFMEEVCPSCDFFDDGCQLEDPSTCPKMEGVMCPYRDNIRECPQIKKLSRRRIKTKRKS